MISFPSLKSSLKQYRLTSAEAWSDRLTIWLAAVAAGLSIVGFSYLTEFALKQFYHLRNLADWAPLLVTPLGGVAVVWLTRRFFPYAAGSGIPQVIVAMDANVKPTVIHQLVSMPIAFAKCLLGSAALACGFSTGREGPSVQIAAAVFYRMRSGLSERTILHDRDLLLAGGAAGIAAAFNAPLAGIVQVTSARTVDMPGAKIPMTHLPNSASRVCPKLQQASGVCLSRMCVRLSGPVTV